MPHKRTPATKDKNLIKWEVHETEDCCGRPRDFTCVRKDGRRLYMPGISYEKLSETKDGRKHMAEMAEGVAKQKPVDHDFVITHTCGCGVHIDPPCFCYQCSLVTWPTDFFWRIDSTRAAGDVETMIARMSVLRDIHNRYLTNNGITQRKRWSKKTVAQRRAILTAVYPEMQSHALIRRLHEGKYETATHKVDEAFLTPSLNIDVLSTDPDELFRQLCFRAKSSPADCFRHDWQFVTDQLHRTKVNMPYIYGAFSIRAENYGTWMEWDDVQIHAGHAVTAPYFYRVIKVQLETMKVLNAVLESLPIRDIPKTQGDFWEVMKATEPLDLPCLEDPRSALADVRSYGVRNSIIAKFAAQQQAEAISQLESLHSSNMVFVTRYKECQDFSNALGTTPEDKSSMTAYLLLVAPHEKAIAWNLFRSLLENLSDLTESAPPVKSALDTRFFFLGARLETAIYMLRQRMGWLQKLVCVIVQQADKPHIFIPAEISGSPREWLEYACRTPYDATSNSPIMSSYEDHRRKQNSRPLDFIQPLYREMLDEIAVLVYIVDILTLQHPTRLGHTVSDGAVRKPHRCFATYIHPEVTFCESRVQAEDHGAAVASVLQPITVYRIPSGKKDEVWHRNQQFAVEGLRTTWSKFRAIRHGQVVGDKVASVWMSRIIEPLVAAAKKAAQDQKQAHAIAKEYVFEAARSGSADLDTQFFETAIPHVQGPTIVSAKKVSKKHRQFGQWSSVEPDKSLYPQSDKCGDRSTEFSLEYSRPQPTSKPVIIIRRSLMEVVESLYSTSMNATTPVRWNTFCQFMLDAGCVVDTAFGGNSFTWTNHEAGIIERRITVHRPHPVPILDAYQVRNAAGKIQKIFGWEEDWFVPKA